MENGNLGISTGYKNWNILIIWIKILEKDFFTVIILGSSESFKYVNPRDNRSRKLKNNKGLIINVLQSKRAETFGCNM